jgi:hypothetical protein
MSLVHLLSIIFFSEEKELLIPRPLVHDLLFSNWHVFFSPSSHNGAIMMRKNWIPRTKIGENLRR